ncbi:hypothetical protein LCGC14_1655710 [marine sediment metagenome]|uniref:Uncharacterized protein n=1 Tax=marine sediment metagenome TaxID=412755 RepID=A0A0F9KVQ9_9ZZZZ
MSIKTCETTADDIIAAGGGHNLIVAALRSLGEQMYNRGYRACTLDHKKRRDSKRVAMDKSFRKELDIIDDVLKSKWA